LTLD